MTLEESIQGFRSRVLREAARTGNVSATCVGYEVSRTLFYRWRHQYTAVTAAPRERHARPRPRGSGPL